MSYYDDRAHGLVAVLADGAAKTLEQVRTWHPRFADLDDETLRAAPAAGTFTLDDARLVYAREHGFASWAELANHLTLLEGGKVEEPFLELLEAGKQADWPRVVAILHAHPDLINARGSNGNSLLGLASGLLPCEGDELTGPAAELLAHDRLGPLRFLLAAGADPNLPNDRGWTPLHQAGYRNDPAMATLLLEAGARPEHEAHGAGGTALAVALFWGHREAADRLAEALIAPANLRIAGGLGRLDLIDGCFEHGGLTDAARRGRGFYRPHSGFPTWHPSNDPQEILDEALVWAAKSNRVQAMAALVERGARIDADPYRGTPLLWAASRGRLEATAWLLDRGADVNQRATFGGPGHGEGITALHLAAQIGLAAMVDLLLSRGADPAIRDRLYDGTPKGWAEYHGHELPALG